MISVINKTPTELLNELNNIYGNFVMVEDNLKFKVEDKDKINKLLFIEKKIPKFSNELKKVGYEDGCKFYFIDDSFVICRFSGTEPLLRIFAEAKTDKIATKYINDLKEFLNIK